MHRRCLRLTAVTHPLASYTAAGALASILPQMIDQMTPQGKIPDEQSDPVAQALAMLNARRAG